MGGGKANGAIRTIERDASPAAGQIQSHTALPYYSHLTRRETKKRNLTPTLASLDIAHASDWPL